MPRPVDLPLLNELTSQGDIAIFGINHEDRPEEKLGFLAEFGDPYTRVAADRNGQYPSIAASRACPRFS